MKTLIFSLQDALDNVKGPAPENRIFERDDIVSNFETFIKNKDKILLYPAKGNDKIFITRKVFQGIKNINKDCEIVFCTQDNSVIHQFENIKAVSEAQSNHITVESFCKIVACEHIFHVGQYLQNYIYVDQFLNIIASNNDTEYCRNFNFICDFFDKIYYPILKDKGMQIRNKIFEDSF